MIIPNSFQTPNLYIDRAMPYLTDSELRCLVYAVRHILGWQDRIGRRRGKISLSMFENGFTTKDGTYYAGCGLGRQAIIAALKTLVENGLLIRIGEADEDGQEWELGSTDIQWEKLEQRQNKIIDAFKARTTKARERMAEKRLGGMSDIPVLFNNTTPGMSDNTGGGMSDNTQTKPSSKQNSKPITRKREKVAKVANPETELFKGLKEAIRSSMRWETPTRGEWGQINAAAKQLAEVGCPVEDIPPLYKHCAALFTTFTPMALATHYSTFKANRPKPKPVFPIPEGHYDPALDDGTPATLEQIQAAKAQWAALLKSKSGNSEVRS